MKTKGQVTIFIIVALVLVAGVLGYFLVKDRVGKSPLEVYSENVFIYTFDCLESVSEEVILGVGQGGGYFYPPEFSTLEGVTYYYGKNEIFNFPLLEDIEEEISLIVSEKLIECTGNFSNFTNYEINFDVPETKTKIFDEKVNIFVEYPIRIRKGEEKVILEEFEIDVKVRLGLIYGIVDRIISEEPLKKGICLSCNFQYSLDNNLKIDYLNYDLITTIFIIRDEKLKINGELFEFVFANDYSEENGI